MISEHEKVQKIVTDIVTTLSSNSEMKKQLELFISLRKESISIEEFFDKQKKLDEIMMINSEEVDGELLKQLNPKIYEHELKHKLIWDKYGVQTKFFCWYNRKNTYFVLDIDFKEVAKLKNLNFRQIVDIYKEMQMATFMNDNVHDYSVVIDVLQYEVLNGTDDLDETGLYRVFLKYKWNGVRV